jgi:CBS-domain-containing membrane protein
MLAGSQHDFPVLNDDGSMLGLVTRRRLVSALADHGPGYPAQLIVERCEETLDPFMPLPKAMDRLKVSGCHALPVIDPVTDTIIGLLNAENIAEALIVRAALEQRTASTSV